jgi:hypothetical protein
MTPTYQDLALTVFTLMVAFIPAEKAINIAAMQAQGKYANEDIEAAKLALAQKITAWGSIQ